MLGDARVVGVPHRVDIVLAVGLAIARFVRGGDRHGVLRERETEFLNTI